jgi:PAS domain S-box-containing protein
MNEHSVAAGIEDGSLFRSLFTAYPDSLLVADGAGLIVLANPSAAALLGYEVAELVGMNVDALVPDSIRPRHAAYREAYGTDPRPRPMGMQMDLVARRKNGSEVRVEIALSPLKNDGRPLVVAAIRDIGSYPRVKQALQRARYSEHLAQLGRLAVNVRDPQELLDLVPRIAATALEVEAAMVCLLENNGLELKVAAGFGALGGEPVGARISNRPGTRDGLVLAQGRPLIVHDMQHESRFPLSRAEVEAGVASALAVPLSDRDRIIGVLGVRSTQVNRFGEDEVHFLESLSNLLATSLQRAKTEEALNHAQRLESVGQLTGGIAHDFNNLLTVIQGNLQVLEEHPALVGEAYAQQLVTTAARASKRGAELTGKLLAFARRQVLQPSAVDVNALLLSLADMLRRTLDQHIEIEVHAPPCPHCLADAGQLEAALLNIAINARDAMPNGGSLRFRAVQCDALPVDAIGGDDDQTPGASFVAISVSDTGNGMSAEVREHVFEPFFTTKELGRGTGLGLSTVYGFVKQSRGGVSLTSTRGVGTTVTLFIPSVSDDTPPDSLAEIDQEVTPGLRVLLVEDDFDVRAVIEIFLDALHCEVTSLSSGEQALQALQGDVEFDLLLTDIALGAGMRGTELARLAQARDPALGILLMSGFSAELLEADRESPPAWELLRKPCTRTELARAIASVVRV